VSCNITVGKFHTAPRLVRKSVAAARRRAELPESAAAARPFCRRRRRGVTGLGLLWHPRYYIDNENLTGICLLQAKIWQAKLTQMLRLSDI